MTKIPFSEDELKVVGSFVNPMGPPIDRYNTPITPNENINLWLKGEPVWLPTTNDFMGTTPRIIADNVARGFAFENLPRLTAEESGGPDMFGTEWVFVPVAGGSMVKPGNPRLKDANDWKSEIVMPDVDSWDWAATAELNKGFRDTGRAYQTTILTGFYERLISFMDFEGAAMALIDEEQQDAVHELFSALCDVYEKIVAHCIDAYGINGITLHDDWGAQRAPFFSLATAMEMIVPYVKRMVDFCHKNGLWLQMHSCGKNELLVPAYIAAGCDIWSGQPMNDKYMLYDKYGDQIHLGIDLPALEDASLEEIDKFAKDFVEKFKAGTALVSARGARPELLNAIYKYSRIEFAK